MGKAPRPPGPGERAQRTRQGGQFLGRLHYAPLVAVVLALVALALLLGKRAVTTTETQVIERVVAQYLRETGATARRKDCWAVPATSQELWLVVSCAPADGARIDYFIDAFGRVTHAARGLEGAALRGALPRQARPGAEGQKEAGALEPRLRA